MKALNEINKKQLRTILQIATTKDSLKNDKFGYLFKNIAIKTKLEIAKDYISELRRDMRWDAMTLEQRRLEIYNRD